MDTMTHIERFENAVACKPADRTCYVNFDGGLIGRYANPEFKAGDLYKRPSWAIDQIIAGAKKMGGDTVPPYLYGPMMAYDYTGTYYETPGRELPDEGVCQAIETNPFKEEHYEYIFENGIQAWEEEFVIPNWPEWTMEEFERGIAISEEYSEKWRAATADDPWFDLPIPGWGGAMIFGMVRGVVDTLMDMYEEPEKVAKAVRMFDEWEMAMNEQMAEEMGGMNAVCISAGRYDNKQAGPDAFDETMWPSWKFDIDYANEHNLKLYIHADGAWEKTIERHIEEFPKGRTIFQCDGFTDVESVYELFVKNQICFFGDVHPTTLCFGEPQQVYDRVIALRKMFGDGLILSSGCGAPWNMKLENIDAFVEAARTPNF